MGTTWWGCPFYSMWGNEIQQQPLKSPLVCERVRQLFLHSNCLDHLQTKSSIVLKTPVVSFILSSISDKAVVVRTAGDAKKKKTHTSTLLKVKRQGQLLEKWWLISWSADWTKQSCTPLPWGSSKRWICICKCPTIPHCCTNLHPVIASLIGQNQSFFMHNWLLLHRTVFEF